MLIKKKNFNSVCVRVRVSFMCKGQSYFFIHVSHRCSFSNPLSRMTRIFKDENICDLCVINGASAAHKPVQAKHNTVISGLLVVMKVRKWGVTFFFLPQLIYAILIILVSSFHTPLNAAYVTVIYHHHMPFCIPPHNRRLVCGVCLKKATQRYIPLLVKQFGTFLPPLIRSEADWEIQFRASLQCNSSRVIKFSAKGSNNGFYMSPSWNITELWGFITDLLCKCLWQTKQYLTTTPV